MLHSDFIVKAEKFNPVHRTTNYTAKVWDEIFVDTTNNYIEITPPQINLKDGSVFRIIDSKGTFGINKCVILYDGVRKLGLTTSYINLNTNGILVELTYNSTNLNWSITAGSIADISGGGSKPLTFFMAQL